MSRERITIAIVEFALVFAVVWVDWNFETVVGTLALLTLLGALALSELYPLLRRMGLDSYPGLGVGGLIVLFLIRGLGGHAGMTPAEMRALVLFLFAALGVAPLVAVLFTAGARQRPGREEFERAAVTLFGLFYIWFFLSFLLELRLIPDTLEVSQAGLKLTVILVLAVKMGDSSAYLVGRTVGRTPMTWVSPKKTWEGAAGSVGGAVLVCLVLGISLGFAWWQMLLFAVVTNVAGQLGDLLESLVKRRSGVKDSGTLLREMGGFLDMLDSLLLAGPAGYLFARIVVL